MSSIAMLSGAVFVFVIVAILYYQSLYATEHFLDVPDDLNKAPNAKPISFLPKSIQLQPSIPGVQTEALATQRELQSLEDVIETWLTAASRIERSNPAALTPTQKQERVLLQTRLESVRRQISSGLITDTFRAVQEDTKRIQSENTIWGQTSSQIDSIDSFAKAYPADATLNDAQYRDFRGLVEAGYDTLTGYLQPEPLQSVRMQQLQSIRMDLNAAEEKGTPSIQVGNARIFLLNMLQPDQPLPSLLQIPQKESFANPSPNLHTVDIVRGLQDIQWKLQHQNNPALHDASESIREILLRLHSVNPSINDIQTARDAMVEFQNMLSPDGFPVFASDELSPIQIQAQTMCKKIYRAFPEDAEALGCPADTSPVSKHRSQQIIHTVCDRLRYSVPTVSTEQFNCPVTK
jgi:hypothetical protein